MRIGELADGGAGVRMNAAEASGDAVVFFVRYDGKPYGYLNRCAHVPMELDWVEGQFFENSGLYLMCATHGAIYEPDNGKCVGRPCRGARLRQLRPRSAKRPKAARCSGCQTKRFALPDFTARFLFPIT